MRNSGLFSTNSPSCKMKLQTKKLSTIARTLLYRWSESGLTEVQMRSQQYIFQGADGYTVSRSFLWVKMGVWYKMLCDIVISDVSPYLYLGVFAIQKAERHRWLPMVMSSDFQVWLPGTLNYQGHSGIEKQVPGTISKGLVQGGTGTRQDYQTAKTQMVKRWISDQALDALVAGDLGAPLPLCFGPISSALRFKGAELHNCSFTWGCP